MDRPNVRELECFVAVADHLNFSRAARSLHLSQPPLTRQIKALEEKIGSRLLERNTHAVSLTAAGELFLEDARAILNRLDYAGETLRRAHRGETARLRLAFIGALLDEKLVRLIRQFRHARPACQVQVADLPPAAQLAALRTGELDGGFIGAKPPGSPGDLAFAIWSKEPLLLALPEEHELAKSPTLRWRDLRNRSWIMVSRHAAPAFRRQFAELAEKHALAARIVQESDRVPAVLTMVAAGSGVSLVPQAVERLIGTGIYFRALPGPQIFLRHAFAYRERTASEPLRHFLALLAGSNRRE